LRGHALAVAWNRSRHRGRRDCRCGGGRRTSTGGPHVHAELGSTDDERRRCPRPTIQYKSGTRAYIESQGYDIFADFGDQFSDLLGGFSDKTFKMPNPNYYLP